MVFEKIKDMIHDELNIPTDKITLESNLKEDLQADSIDVVQLIMGIEEEFSIEINEEDGKCMRTVKDLVDFIETNKK